MNYELPTTLRVRLVEVQGDQEEYADLIGWNGGLFARGESGRPVFRPDGRGDWLTMGVRDLARAGDRITIKTRLGNTFVFRVLEAAGA